ncbi:MAG: saccharopine dehydrogenase NADP-binding domain-containing protein, partial [Candidatus Sericytochromatia bacterium]|nr:saccharopine dehydrogenase NADP-binding domain-containing protein [Candidatus Sericytochromatia bacterium]
AYDMAKFGDAESVLLADIDLQKAENAAQRVNKLLGKNIAHSAKLEVSNQDELVKLLTGIDSFLSAVPYQFNLQVAEAAIKAGASMCDLGGNTDVVRDELKLNNQAKEAGITIIPDCGLMPGMGNTLAVYGMSKLDSCDEVQVRCGGLPQNPKPPLGYKMVFSIGGLTNEYFGKAFILRDGKVTEVDTFDELEKIEFADPIGECEAFTTTGGSSTCPWTFEGKLKTYEYKTVRYPGHYDKFKTMLDLGLLDTKPVQIKGMSISPRDVFHTVVAPKIDFPEDKDLVVLRSTCKGLKDGKKVELVHEIIDFHDDQTGFTAMERTTAFPASIVAIMLAKGQVDRGAISLETGVDGTIFVEELKKRGIKLTETVKTEL